MQGSVQCADVACIKDYFNRTCPEAFQSPPYEGPCSLKGSLDAGHVSFLASVYCFFAITCSPRISEALLSLYSEREAVHALMHRKSPLCSLLVKASGGNKTPVLTIAGRCEKHADAVYGIAPALNDTIVNFQETFPHALHYRLYVYTRCDSVL